MPYKDPEKAKANSRKVYYAKHEHYKAQKKEWARSHPEYARRQGLKRRYGLTPEDVISMLSAQNGMCALCPRELVYPCPNRNTHVDHDHETGRIRGILCNKCNTSLGAGRDRPEYLKRLLTYLKLEGF